MSRCILVACIFSLSGLIGCGPSVVEDSQPGNLSYANNLMSHINADTQLDQKQIGVLLAESATSVSQSLRKLAEIERAVHPQAQISAGPIPAQIGMADLASVDWTGPAEPLLNKLAQSSHYRLSVIGKRPTVPLLVAINSKNTPIATIIRDVSYQIQRDADIKIYPSRKRVELRYH